MNNTSQILKYTSHRPVSLPQRSWKYFQDWAGTVFLHYKVPEAVLQQLLPPGLVVDTIEGEAWVSVVAFTVKDMRVKYLPPFPYVSDFHEVNLRTYVTYNGVPGIYFITVEASKRLTAFLATTFIGIDYKKARLKRKTGSYTLKKSRHGNMLDLRYIPLHNLNEVSPLDHWLTERYCAYEMIQNTLYRFNIHHKPWVLKKVKIKQYRMHFKKGNLVLENAKPDLQHFCHDQKVVLWGREKC